MYIVHLPIMLESERQAVYRERKKEKKKVRSSVFSNRVVDVWNSLPNAVVTAPSLNAFKSRLNKHWHGHELKFNAPCYIPGETMFSNFVRCSNGSLEVA